MYSLEAVFGHIASFIDGHDDIIRIQYNVTEECSVEGCNGIVADKNINRIRQISHFESTCKNNNNPDDVTTQELMHNYWARRMDSCIESQKRFFGAS